MKKSELEDIILEETLKLLEEEGETLEDGQLDEVVGLLGRGIAGLGRLAARRGAEQVARRRAASTLARTATRRGATPAVARQQAAQTMAAADDARQLRRLGVRPAAAAREAGLPRGFAQVGTTAAQRAGYAPAFRSLSTTGGRTADRALGAAGLYAAGLGREGGLDVPDLIPDIDLPDVGLPSLPDVPSAIRDAATAAQMAYQGVPYAYSPGARGGEQLQQMVQTGAEQLGDVATTVAGGGRPPVGIAGPVGTTQARPPAMPTQSQRQAALASTRPTQAPRQPAPTSPASGKPGTTTPVSGKLAAAQDTYRRTGGTGRLPVAEGSDLPNVRPAWTVSENVDKNDKEYNSDMEFKKLQLEAMVLEELTKILNEQDPRTPAGEAFGQAAQALGIPRTGPAVAAGARNLAADMARDREISAATGLDVAEPMRGFADIPGVGRETVRSELTPGVGDLGPEERERINLQRRAQAAGQDAIVFGQDTAAGQYDVPTTTPAAAPEPEPEREERPRRSRSRREEPAAEPAATPAGTKAPGTSATAAGKGPGATTAGKGPGATATGKGPGGGGKPAEAPATPTETPPRGETLRGPMAGFNPVRAIGNMFPGRMEEVPIREGQVREAMAALKEGFAIYFPKK